MQETANYKLKKLELTDFADITDLNSNADIVDMELKKLTDEKAPLESPVLTGTPAAPTPVNETNLQQIVNIEYVKEALKTVDLSSKLDHTAVVQNADLNTLLDDKAYICVGTLKNTPVLNTYCIVRCYDGATTNRVVQICYIPQSDNTVRTFVRAVTSTTTFGKWVELGSVTKVNDIVPDDTGNVALPVATAENYGLVRVAKPTDVLDTVEDAAITPAVYHDVSDFRHKQTAYNLGDKVECMFNHELFLECTQAGTTASTPLDTRNVKHGQVLTDGSVQWTVRTHIKSVNGVVAGANGDVVIDAGVPVGFEYFSTNPNIQAGSIPLMGGLYSRTTYADLWAWVQQQKGYLLTESEWQQKATANGGNVPYYSDGDGTTTFRVPALSCWVRGAKGLEEVGGYLESQFPAHKHDIGFDIYPDNSAIYGTKEYTGGSRQAGWGQAPTSIKSAYTSTEGKGTNVQPPSIIGMWCVKAYGSVSNVGETDLADVAQGLTELETRVGGLENHSAGATVIESYRKGAAWYRRWSDGWLEQGGFATAVGGDNGVLITFLKPYIDEDYTVAIANLGGNHHYEYDDEWVSDKTNTSFKFYRWGKYPVNWYACGQGV